MKKIIFFALSLFFIALTTCRADTLNDRANEAAALYRSKDYAKAIHICEDMLEIRPRFWRAFLIEAKCYHAQGQDTQALAEAQKGLDYHPDNVLLRQLVEVLCAVPSPTATAGNAKDDDDIPTTTPVVHSLTETKVWVKFSAAPAFGTLDDFQNAAAEWRNFFTNSDHVDAGNGGLLAHAEFGAMLDQTNGLALAFTGGAYDSLIVDGQAVTTISSASVTYHYQQSSSPTLADAELVYYHFWPTKDGRYYFKVGGGVGLANVNFFSQSVFTGSYVNDGITNGPEDLSAFNITCSGGIGYEWMVADGLGLEVSVEGRYASFSGLTGSGQSVYANGTTLDSGQVGLYKGTKGRFEVDYAGAVPSGVTPVTVDFSGFDCALAVNAYFF